MPLARQAVTPINFTAPPALPPQQAQPIGMPQSRLDALAYALKSSQPVDYSTVQSPLEGLAKALTSGLHGWEASQVSKGNEQQKQSQAKSIADLLAPPTNPDGSANPKNAQLVSMLTSGALSSDALSGAVAQKIGFGGVPKDNLIASDKPIYNATNGQWIMPPKGATTGDKVSDLQLLINERNAAAERDPNDPMLANYDAAIAKASGQEGPDAMFPGKTVESAGLNWLVGNKVLSPQQAAELAASKQITDPASGVIYLALPTGIFRIPPGGQPEPAAPMGGAPGGAVGNPAPSAAPPASPAQPQPMPTPTVQANPQQPAPFPLKEQTPPGMVPLTQGKPDKSEAQGEAQSQTANAVLDAIDRAIPQIKARPAVTTGVIGALSQNLPGTPAYDVAALLDTIKSNVGFDKLQSMRAASPTGGALGQVSEFENRLLQSVFGSLSQAQSTDQLLYNMQRIRNLYGDVVTKGQLTAIGRLVDSGQISYDEGVQRANSILNTAPASPTVNESDPLGLFQ